MYRLLLAALSLYTRLPAWRLARLETADYQRGVIMWPWIGLVTGGALALGYLLGNIVFGTQLSIILALGLRLILTGAFHEDGLGDFFDGFGGGHSAERVLTIMKDSHVGSYAVLGYVVYYLCYIYTVSELATQSSIYYGRETTIIIALHLLLSDVLGKLLSFQQIVRLPYARATEQSKLGHGYQANSWIRVQLPLALTLLAIVYYTLGIIGLLALLVPIAVASLMLLYVYRRIGGYTGDTCGALSLIIELSTLLGLCLALSLSA